MVEQTQHSSMTSQDSFLSVPDTTFVSFPNTINIFDLLAGNFCNSLFYQIRQTTFSVRKLGNLVSRESTKLEIMRNLNVATVYHLKKNKS